MARARSLKEETIAASTLFTRKEDIRDKLDTSIAEIFEIFSVNRKTSIDLQDVTVALRMLGVEVSQEQLRKDVLPEYAEDLTEDGRLQMREFKQILLKLRADGSTQPAVDTLFSSLDKDKPGILTLKSLQAINTELLQKGLEQVEYPPDQIEAMVQGVFSSDHITKSDFQKLLQRQ